MEKFLPPKKAVTFKKAQFKPYHPCNLPLPQQTHSAQKIFLFFSKGFP
jgi:hypothetical protein